MASETKVGDLVRVTASDRDLSRICSGATTGCVYEVVEVSEYGYLKLNSLDDENETWMPPRFVTAVRSEAPSSDHHAKLQADYHKALAEIARLRVAVKSLAALVPDHALDIGGGE